MLAKALLKLRKTPRLALTGKKFVLISNVIVFVIIIDECANRLTLVKILAFSLIKEFNPLKAVALAANCPFFPT